MTGPEHRHGDVIQLGPTSQRPRPGEWRRRAVLDFVRAQLGDAYALGSTGPDDWDMPTGAVRVL